MNSRERVLAALNHQTPDRVPVDLGGGVSGIHINAYKGLLKMLDIEDPNITFYDFVQQIVIPCPAVLDRLHIDTRHLYPNGACLPEDYEPEVVDKWIGIYDQFGVFWGNGANKPREELLYFSPAIHPLAKLKTVEEIHNYSWPDGTDKSVFMGLGEKAKQISNNGEFAVSSRVVACIYEYTTFMFGFSKAMRHMRKNPEILVAAMEELAKYWLNYTKTFLTEVGNNVDILAVNGDLADQTGPIMNPKMYEKFIKPIEKAYISEIKKLTDMKINYHSCGGVSEFVPHYIDIGYDAMNPIQISATDMEPCSLKSRFGEKITFWGSACDSQKTLPFGTSEQVRAEVKHNLECMMPNGGFIASPIHNITAEVPPENIVAMFDALHEFGKYR